MATKHYYAYVKIDWVERFEERLRREDKVKFFIKELAVSETGEPIFYYKIEAEEGLINSKWELK